MNKVTGKDILEIYELEKKYEEMVGSKDSMAIYPDWWYSTDYSTRKQVVNQALSENSMIKDLKEVKEMEYRESVNKLFDRFEEIEKKSGKSYNQK